MNYWPTSVIANDTRLHHSYMWELLISNYTGLVSETTMIAAQDICGQVRPCTAPMVVTPNKGAPDRRVYLSEPSSEDFAVLERGGFYAFANGFGFMLDALH